MDPPRCVPHTHHRVLVAPPASAQLGLGPAAQLHCAVAADELVALLGQGLALCRRNHLTGGRSKARSNGAAVLQHSARGGRGAGRGIGGLSLLSSERGSDDRPHVLQISHVTAAASAAVAAVSAVGTAGWGGTGSCNRRVAASSGDGSFRAFFYTCADLHRCAALRGTTAHRRCCHCALTRLQPLCKGSSATPLRSCTLVVVRGDAVCDNGAPWGRGAAAPTQRRVVLRVRLGADERIEHVFRVLIAALVCSSTRAAPLQAAGSATRAARTAGRATAATTRPCGCCSFGRRRCGTSNPPSCCCCTASSALRVPRGSL